MIDATSWVPENVKNIVLDLANSIYLNIGMIFLVLVVILIILLFLTSKSETFNKILPKEKNYIDNMTVSWNGYSGINRVVRIIVSLATVFWIYYFLINILFNEYNFVTNFIIDKSNQLNQNQLIVSGYMTSKNLGIMNFLFYLNLFITVFFIIRSLFEIRLPTTKYSIKSDEIDSYIPLNSFQYQNYSKETIEIILLKTKFKKKTEFLLINVQLTKRSFEDLNHENLYKDTVEIDDKKRIYKIMNYSNNLDEIIYHFDTLKKYKLK